QAVHARVGVRPAVAERGLIQRPQVRLHLGAIQEIRTRRDQQADRVLYRVDIVDQIVLLDERQHIEVIAERGPRGEGYPGRPRRDARGADDPDGLDDLRSGVVLLQDLEYALTDRLDRGDDEQAAEPAEFRQDGAALQNVLD